MDQRRLELSDNSGVIVLSRNTSAENINLRNPNSVRTVQNSKFYKSGMFTSELQVTQISQGPVFTSIMTFKWKKCFIEFFYSS